MLKNLLHNVGRRRIRFEVPRKYDVLILQEVEAEFLVQCIPQDATTKICAIEREIPLILSFSYLANIFAAIARGIRPGPAVLRAAIKIWDPGVVLSGETISNLPGEVSLFFPNKQFIVISRCVLAPPLLPKKLPIFYSFGNYDRDVLDKVGAEYAEHHPIGSLKAAIIKREFGDREKQFNICFISQYRESIAERKVKADASSELEQFYQEMFDAYNPANAFAFESACRFAKERNMKLCIAMSAPRHDAEQQEKERKYFFSCLGFDFHPTFLPRTSTSSYEAVMSSCVSVTVDSSLGYEALGLREKVLFLAQIPCMHRYYQKQFGLENPIYYSRIPSELKVMSKDYAEFERKLTFLMSLGDAQYRRLTEEARTYYMTNCEGTPPDVFLSGEIRSILKKTSSGDEMGVI